MYTTITAIKEANKQAGLFYFSKRAMRFFRSRVAPGVIAGCYFVTSEQIDDNSPRLYTVRCIRENASIETIGKFQAYRTLQAARRAARIAAGKA